MFRLILVYGCIAGLIAVINVAIAGYAKPDSMVVGMAIGYSIMLIALSLVFVGTKKYRDEHLGGVIRFATAVGVGGAISAIASVIYVLGWEAHLYTTDYRFMSDYAASIIEAKRAAGASAAEVAKTKAELDSFAESYSRPAYRMMITLTEIAPVALLVTLISAALLKNSNLLPAHGRRQARP